MSLLIFDLDGVLVDTVEGHYSGWSAVATSVGITFDRIWNDSLRGVSRAVALEMILAGNGLKLDSADKLALLELKAAAYRDWVLARSDSLVDPLVANLLKDLRRAGFRLSVASASTNAKWILQQTGLYRYFAYVSDGSSVTKSKPHPEQISRILQYFECKARSAILFEDAQVGIEAGVAAGVGCVGIGTQALSGVITQFRYLSQVSVDDISEILNAWGRSHDR